MIQSKLYSILFLSYLFTTITLCSSLNPSYEACQPATCGKQTITYPFYIEGRQRSFCGYPGFGLSCSYNSLPIINISNIQYIIHEISYRRQSIRVSEAAAATSSSNGTSSCVIPRTRNLTLEGTSFSFALNQIDLFLVFGCNLGALPEDLGKYRVGCSEENETRSVLALTGEGKNLRSAFENCNGGVVKTKVDNNTNVNGEVLRRGFVLNWTASECSLCQMTGGMCGFNSSESVYSFKCYCPDADHARRCAPGAEKNQYSILTSSTDWDDFVHDAPLSSIHMHACKDRTLY